MTAGSAQRHDHAYVSVDQPMEERIAFIRSPRWIGYTQAKKILSQLEDMLTHPKTHRMPSLLIVGDTNAGKTMLANRFAQLHPDYHLPHRDIIVVPVLLMQSPPGPDESRFYDMIIESLLETYQPHGRASLAKKQSQVLRLLQLIDLQMLMIDEIQNIVTGPVSKQRQFLNVLKYLSNALQIPLVGLGTKEALRAIQADPQLANRFTPVALPPWRMGREFLRLLASFEQVLPLRQPSRLIEERLARTLLALSEGSLGELAALLTAAAIYAIRSGIEQINEQVLANLDWIPPSKRRREAEYHA